MEPLLKNIEHQTFLDNNGYIKLPFLEEEAVLELTNLAKIENIINETDCYASNTVSEQEKNNRITKQIHLILGKHLERLFIDYSCYGGTFLIKTNQNGELGYHQDTTIVNPEKDRMYYFWIPLQDVNRRNGCLFLIEKSHLFFNNYFSYSYFNADIKRNKLPYKYGKDIEMKAGEIFIFSSRLFHGSYRNYSKIPRLAVQSIITAKDASLVYYFQKNNQTCEEYEVSPSSYLNSYHDYKNGGLPADAKLNRSFLYKHIVVDFKQLYAMASGKPYTEYTRWFTFLQTRFSDLLNNKIEKDG
jgi:hypothetical protein